MALDRRALLGLAVGAAALGGSASGPADTSGGRSAGTPHGRPSPAVARHRYGTEHDDQYGDLRLPTGGKPLSTVVLLHGGFWQDSYGLDLMDDLATAITALGHATWNVEYRRLGDGGGWPQTFEDVAAAVEHLRRLTGSTGTQLVGNVIVLGHSAGGHLAAWAASRTARTPGGPPQVPVRATISLSGVLDLRAGAAEFLGGGTLQALMGGGPAEVPERYRLGDPIALVPADGPVWAVHGASDIVVPLEQSTAYVSAARRAGGRAELVEVPGEHLDLIDPSAEAWTRLRDLVGAAARA